MTGALIKPKVSVVDHGTGNITSLLRALELGGAVVDRVTDPIGLAAADALVLPGVGAFPVAMKSLGDRGFVNAITEHVESGTPLLGVCLGMQMLFESSEEMGGALGLGILSGRVTRLEAGGLRLPHIGWSPLEWRLDSPLREGLTKDSPMYHVHSFVAVPGNPDEILATAVHGASFATAVGRDNVFGVQFHPEKSSTEGLRMVANFVQVCAARIQST